MISLDDMLSPDYGQSSAEYWYQTYQEGDRVPNLAHPRIVDLLGLLTIIPIIVPFMFPKAGSRDSSCIVGLTTQPDAMGERCLVVLPSSKKTRALMGWWRLEDINGIQCFASVDCSVQEIIDAIGTSEPVSLVAGDYYDERVHALSLILSGLSSGSEYKDIFQSRLGQFEHNLKLSGKFYQKDKINKCQWSVQRPNKAWSGLTFSDLLEFVDLEVAK